MELYIVGDVHGQLEKLKKLLTDANLIDSDNQWIGGDRHLLFIGDYVDRGPDGIGVIELIMNLQSQSVNSNGKVEALLGNHDVLFLSAYYFQKEKAGGPGGNFIDDWLINGGEESDMNRLTPEIIHWISNLPAMTLIGETLFAHADSNLYLKYGKTIDEVNHSFRSILAGRDPVTWDMINEYFSDRLAFFKKPEEIEVLLETYGGRRFIHGHTPITYMNEVPAENIIEPFQYASGRCMNIDSGMYRGSNGFIVLLNEV